MNYGLSGTKITIRSIEERTDGDAGQKRSCHIVVVFFGLFTFACFCFDLFLFFLFAFFFKSGELRLLEYPIITPCFYWRGKFHSPWIQSSVGKKMATGTFTHSS